MRPAAGDLSSLFHFILCDLWGRQTAQSSEVKNLRFYQKRGPSYVSAHGMQPSRISIMLPRYHFEILDALQTCALALLQNT